MSDMTMNAALDRIQLTPEVDPLAVFQSEEPGCVNVVFYKTIETFRWIAEGAPVLLGVFHGNSPRGEVKQAIRMGMRNA